MRRPCALLAVAALAATRPTSGEKELGGGWKEKTKPDGKVVQELKIEAPAFTEEDQYGYVMPERYRCDSCRAVMFHLDQDLRKSQPKSRRLKQWEYTDVFDATCRTSFEGYGVKLVNGENTLSGPGLKHDDTLAPGSGAIQMGGESWSKRLGEICRKIVYEKVGEDELYEKFFARFLAESQGQETEETGLSEALCISELRECRAGPKPPPKLKDSEQELDKAKSKSKKDKKAGKAAAEPDRKTKGKSTKDEAAAKEAVGIQTFLKSLAVKHGLKAEEYSAYRPVAEWEKLIVELGSKISGRQLNETCPSVA